MATYIAPYQTAEATATGTRYAFVLYGSNSTLNSLVEANIPRFSHISSAAWKLKCKRDGGTGSFYHTDYEWTTRDADGNITKTLSSKSDAITTAYQDFSQEYTSYFYSETENAGKINTNLAYSFAFYCDGTLSRTYAVKERCVEYTFDKPKVTINTSKNIDGGLITGSGTYEVEVANYSVTLTAVPENSYKFVKWVIDGKEYTTKDVSVLISQNSISAYETTINAVAYFEERHIPYVTYDSIMNFQKWKNEGVTVTNGVASNITDTGLTLTTNADKTSSRTSSPFFPVEYGKSYKIDIDIEGPDWTVYIFFCDADENRIDFKDATHKFSSSGAGVPSRIFTAPDNPIVVQAQIRLDCRGGGGGTATYSNFRIFPAECEYMSTTVDENERVDYGSWSMPTPVRERYAFTGWNTKPDGSGIVYTQSSAFPTSDLTLFSQWEIKTYTISTDVTPDGAGTVTGGGTYTYEDYAELTAIPNDGYEFAGWTDGNTDNPRTVTIKKNATYTAQFEEVQTSKIRYGADVVKTVFDTNKNKAKSVWYGSTQIL